MSSSQCKAKAQALAACALLVILAGCGHEQVRRIPDSGASDRVESNRPSVKRRSAGEQAAIVATRQVGVPYRYGGNTTRGFDCSGLVQYAWSAAGVRIPRTTSDQWARMSRVPARDMQIGDLLFFRIDGTISHVGMYLGNGRFVHAPSTGRNVSVASLDSGFYKQTFAGAARP